MSVRAPLAVRRRRRRWRVPAAALALLCAGVMLAACGDTGPTGTTNVQGGSNRAPAPGGR